MEANQCFPAAIPLSVKLRHLNSVSNESSPFQILENTLVQHPCLFQAVVKIQFTAGKTVTCFKLADREYSVSARREVPLFSRTVSFPVKRAESCFFAFRLANRSSIYRVALFCVFPSYVARSQWFLYIKVERCYGNGNDATVGKFPCDYQRTVATRSFQNSNYVKYVNMWNYVWICTKICENGIPNYTSFYTRVVDRFIIWKWDFQRDLTRSKNSRRSPKTRITASTVQRITCKRSSESSVQRFREGVLKLQWTDYIKQSQHIGNVIATLTVSLFTKDAYTTWKSKSLHSLGRDLATGSLANSASNVWKEKPGKKLARRSSFPETSLYSLRKLHNRSGSALLYFSEVVGEGITDN